MFHNYSVIFFCQLTIKVLVNKKAIRLVIASECIHRISPVSCQKNADFCIGNGIFSVSETPDKCFLS